MILLITIVTCHYYNRVSPIAVFKCSGQVPNSIIQTHYHTTIQATPEKSKKESKKKAKKKKRMSDKVGDRERQERDTQVMSAHEK
jgi:hypothetical protein